MGEGKGGVPWGRRRGECHGGGEGGSAMDRTDVSSVIAGVTEAAGAPGTHRAKAAGR